MLRAFSVPRPSLTGTSTGAVADRDVVADAWSAWRAEVAFADLFAEEAIDLDVIGNDPWRGSIRFESCWCT